MDFKKSISTRTATLMRAMDLSQKVAPRPPPANSGPKLPANRGANYAAGRMGVSGGLLDNATISSKSLSRGGGGGGGSGNSDTPYVAMDATASTRGAAGSLASTSRSAASAPGIGGSSSSSSPSHDSKNIQRFQADHVPIGNASSNAARMANLQSTLPQTSSTRGAGSGAGGGLPSSPEEEWAFFWELLQFAKNRNWKKKVLSVVICITSFVVLVDLIFFHHVRSIIEAFLQWMTVHPFLAVATFIVFFIMTTLLFVPPIILFFGAGFAFCNVCGNFWYGIVLATIVSCIGSTLGAVLAFCQSRYVNRELVQLFAKRYPVVKAADRAFARNGFHVMLLLRLCPIIPFNSLNYIGGVTNIELDQFVYALVGIVPTVVFWVIVGASADKLASNTADDVSEQILLVALLTAGVLFALAAMVLLFRYAKEELRKEIAADRAHNWHTYQKPTPSSTTTGATLSSSADFAMESGSAGVIQHSDSNDLREEGFEILAQYPTDVLAVLGITESPLENDRVPEDLHDEEWFWVWT
jgi:uncharacterized membrane protein YdjX (TVP38/TMEM64 family)